MDCKYRKQSYLGPVPVDDVQAHVMVSLVANTGLPAKSRVSNDTWMDGTVIWDTAVLVVCVTGVTSMGPVCSLLVPF